MTPKYVHEIAAEIVQQAREAGAHEGALWTHVTLPATALGKATAFDVNAALPIGWRLYLESSSGRALSVHVVRDL